MKSWHGVDVHILMRNVQGIFVGQSGVILYAIDCLITAMVFH